MTPSSLERQNPAGAQEKAQAAGATPEAADPGDERRNDVPEDEGGARGGLESPTDPAVAEQKHGHRGRLRTTLDLIRSNPTGRIALKVFVAITGAIIVAVGIALIPLPGPGWLVVIGGLAVWAVEFHWARRLLTFTRRNVHAWTQWITRQSLPVRILIAAVGLIFIGVVVLLSLKYSLGIDLVANLLRYLATH